MPKYAKTKDTSTTATKRVRYVPFARGFKHRDLNARLLALGYSKAAHVPQEFSCGFPYLFSSSKSESSMSAAESLSASSSSKAAEEFFKPVPQPTSQDDWLAQYDEDGQTYRQFLAENPWMSKRRVKYMKQTFHSEGKTLQEKYPEGKICVLQLGKFDEQQSVKFSDIIDYTARFLCLPVEELAPLDLEVTAGKVVVVDDPAARGGNGGERSSRRVKRSELHSRYNAKTGHIQLRVDSVLSKLRTVIPHQALCLIALTTLDLYGDASDLFVAGMAAGMQRVAVFSLLRYHPAVTFSKEHWYDVKHVGLPTQPSTLPFSDKQGKKAKWNPNQVESIMVQRSCKLVVHEVLHLLGVDHCVFYDCCMNGSGHLAEDFRQPVHLCPIDLRKLHALVGFNVCERYVSLHKFYQKNGLKVEADWVERRLNYLRR